MGDSRQLSSLLVVGFGLTTILLLTACRRSVEDAGYRTVPLLHGPRSLGAPLIGVAVDANHHAVYAIVGRDLTTDGTDDFVILWRGHNGMSYCATFSENGSGIDSICEISPEGKTRRLPASSQTISAPARHLEQLQVTGADDRIDSIIGALPAEF